MPDRVDQRAAELAAQASEERAARESRDARYQNALGDLRDTFVATLAHHTRYAVESRIDARESTFHVSFWKRQFDKTLERQILEVRLNRAELDLGHPKYLCVRVPHDAPLPTSMRPPADDISAGEALRRMLEIALETMAVSVAHGCSIVAPNSGKA